MKENSIEEDITLIEKSLCDKDTIIQYHYWVGTDFLNAVERIVADYKRVLKENEIIKGNYDTLSKDIQQVTKELGLPEDTIIADEMVQMIKQKFIPKSKVKDKIEELKEDKDSKYYDIFLEERDIENTIKILQELLD